jgi:hypothetical protein
MARRRDDNRLAEAQAVPIREIVERLGNRLDLKRAGVELVGPCPACGGNDRFSVNLQRNVFNCRHCGGGDGIRLVQQVLACEFPEALNWLVGAADVQIDPAEQKRRAEKRQQQKERAAREAARRREDAIRAARAIWQAGQPISGSPVERYLARRGIRIDLVPGQLTCLRYHPDLPYMVPGDAGNGWSEIWRGPAMLAAMQEPSGRFSGVHRTWLDLDQPKGKAVIRHNGEISKSKKTLGSKKGSAIRLVQRGVVPVMVMGEGIETTLTAAIAGTFPDAWFWAGIDLGNMAGRRVLSGKGMKYAGVPDLEDADAFLPPPGIERLIYIQDGDSEPKSTRAKLLAGLRRAKAVQGVGSIQIVHAGEGRDLNDVLMGADDE